MIGAMLLGRDREREAIDRRLEDARQGRGCALAIVGEPGIGKTALLDDAAASAGGMVVLRARGIESEAQVPFAGLLELLRPALGLLDRIPPPQASALGGALALEPARAQDRFAVGAATLSLLAAYAEQAPLAVLIDDAHWLDDSTAGVLLFAVRRLAADPVAAILAARAGEPSMLDGSGLETLSLGGLDRQAAAALLAREAREHVDADVADRLYRATAGNPLALLELAPEASQLSGVPTIEGPVPVSARLTEAFLRRHGALPDRTRRALVLAAASDTGEAPTFARAASSIGLEIADLDSAEAAGLITLATGRIEFRHPLARSAIYGEAPGGQRREAHRALADALPDRDVDRRAWHLAEAAIGPDDAATASLEQAGARARARSAYAVAASAFERAARLAPDDGRRPGLLYAAADAAWLAGLAERAVSLLDKALACASDPALVLRIEHLRGHAAMRRGPVMDGYAILVDAATRSGDLDPDRAIVMLAEAVNAAFYAGNAVEMLRAADRTTDLVPRDSSGEAAFFATIAQGMALVFAGRGDVGAPDIRRATAILEASAELRTDPRLLAWAAVGPLWLREAEAGRALITRALDTARAASALGVLPFLLTHVAHDHATTDRWTAAVAGFEEAIALARETRQEADLAFALASLARLEARQGKEDACRAHAAEARALSADLGARLFEVWSVAALGDLELGLGRPEAAVEHYQEQEALLDELGIGDADLSPAAELVEAYLRLGRPQDAAAPADALEAAARVKGQPWALARAARCRALQASEDEMEHDFEEAVWLHRQTPDVFEAARTRLAYGARLRRARKRVRAREELRTALAAFDRLGARSWSDLASGELSATGETARKRDASTLDDLTPQELQIGLLLAQGRTTREAAAALFLSPKTIEYHLRNAYRKLGIHSREELAAALAPGRAAAD
jgi:DNA-binding CsgD family transcriptional regulator